MLATSHDGQWAIRRRGREVALYATATLGSPQKTLTLAADDDEVALVGPPTVLVRISHAHAPVPTRVELFSVPALAPVAKLDLDATLSLAATVGPRLALVGPDVQGALTKVTVVRTAGTALAAQPLEVHGVPVENIVGVGTDQFLVVMRKDAIALYHAVSSRPAGKPNLPLPPPPRAIGAALGHAWATHASTDALFVYRLSDGRPFRHAVGAVVERVVCHPASPVIVPVTPRGLVRLHCNAHALTLLDSPYAPGSDLALVPGATPDQVSLIGVAPDGDVPWRISVGKPA